MKKIISIVIYICAIAVQVNCGRAYSQKRPAFQRVIIIMMDGFGEKYYRQARMPFLNQMEKKGIYKVVPSIMPAVTNVNNMSIATGTTPDKNGITGNVFFDPKTQKETYIEDPSILLVPSIFQKAHELGIKSALLSVKKKTIDVLGKHAYYTLCPECIPVHETKWPGEVPKLGGVYTREITYQIFSAANTLIKNDPLLKLIFIHTTDYPMHMWPPENDSVKMFLANVDRCIKTLHNTAPDAAILITADHGLNHKTQAWDLEKALTDKKVPFKIVISPEKDRYMAHHKGLGGAAYVYLKSEGDAVRVKQILLTLKGVDGVLTRAQAAKKYHLMPERIGDLMVLGDKNTVFGHLDKSAFEKLADNYRSHGSAYETGVPLFVFNAKNAPQAAYFDANYKMAAWLFK